MPKPGAVHLQVEYGSLGPVLTVRSYVHQACSNVIHNAIKYSLPGGVVKTTLRLEDESGKRVVIVGARPRPRHRGQGSGAHF